MLTVVLAALAPCLYWDQGPATANAVKEAGIRRLCVPPDQETAWKAEGVAAQPLEESQFVKVPVPGVEYRMDVASATRMPWIDANGWRFVREPGRRYFCDAPPGKAVLAAAEAYAYGVDAAIHAGPADLAAFGRLLAFLRSIDRPPLPPLVNIGIIDDGSDQTGEVMNLLARRNLLFRVVSTPDPKCDLNVRIGTKEYPEAEAADPFTFAGLLRAKLTDEKRLLRLYGSNVVLGRLAGDAAQARLHLINYSGRKVNGLRVRVRGVYGHGAAAAFGVDHATLADYGIFEGGTEFTIPELGLYEVVDLQKAAGEPK